MDPELTILIVAVVSLLLIGLILMQVYFYLNTFLKICCPPKLRGSGDGSAARGRFANQHHNGQQHSGMGAHESIPLTTTNVTQLMSSHPTGLDGI